MATKKRLIYMDDTMDKLRVYAERKHEAGHTELANGILKAVNYIHNNIVRADAVEVVHGRMNEVEIVPNYMWKYRCSCCHSDVERWYKYCPNCGAKMDGERRNE